MEDNSQLKVFLEIIHKRMILFILLIIFAVIGSALYTHYKIYPSYQTYTQLIVKGTGGNDQLSKLLNTYEDIITSPRILDLVAEESEGRYTSSQLKGKVSVNSSNLLLNIKVRDSDPQRAVAIANEVAEVFIRENPSILNITGIEVLIPADSSTNVSTIVPSKRKYYVLAIGAAIFLGLVIAFLMEYFDNTIKNEDDIKKYLNAPVLGVITVYDKKSKKLVRHVSQQEMLLEESVEKWGRRKKAEEAKKINLG